MPASRVPTQGARASGILRSPALGEYVLALSVGTLVLAAFILLAAIDPATWTFQSNAVSHLRSELWHCLSIKNDATQLDCYNQIARYPPPHPAKGANALPRAFGQEEPWR